MDSEVEGVSDLPVIRPSAILEQLYGMPDRMAFVRQVVENECQHGTEKVGYPIAKQGIAHAFAIAFENLGDEAVHLGDRSRKAHLPTSDRFLILILIIL